MNTQELERIQVSADLVFEVTTKKRSKPRRRKTSRFQAERILKIAKNYGWEGVRVVGHGRVERPIETNGWLVMPHNMYKGMIPEVFLKRVETIRILKEPIGALLIAEDLRKIQKDINRADDRRFGRSVNNDLVPIAVTAAGIGTAIIGGLVYMTVAAAYMALSFDPMLILVTEEYQWISLGEWLD